MTEPTSLEVRNGAWAHVPLGSADDRSAAQQTRDRLLRDLALALHYDRVMPTQGEHAPNRTGDEGPYSIEPYAAQRDGDGAQTAKALREIRALLGEQAEAELLAAATHLAQTKPGR
jgi:hypothetical protein